MSLYRRRLWMCVLLLVVFLTQLLIYTSPHPAPDCDHRANLSWEQLPENITDRASIINLNPRVLCWFPTTLKRLDRALVIYQ